MQIQINNYYMRNRVVKKDLNKVLNSIKMPQSQRYEDVPSQNNNTKQKCMTLGISKDNSNVSQKKQLFNLHYVPLPNRYGIKQSKQQYPQYFKKQRSLQLRRSKMRAEDRTSKKYIEKSPYLQRIRMSLNLKEGQIRHHILNREVKKLLPSRKNTINASNHLTLTNSANYDYLRTATLTKIQKGKQESCQLARQAFSKGNYHQSIKMLNDILQNNPLNQQALYIISMCLMNISEHKKAIKYINRLIDINQKYNKMMYVLASICQTKLNTSVSLNNSRVKLLKCIKLYPQYYDAYMYLGKQEYKQKRPNEAIFYLLKAKQLKVQKTQPLIALGECYMMMKDYKAANEWFEQSLQIGQKHQNIHLIEEALLIIIDLQINNIKNYEYPISLIKKHFQKYPKKQILVYKMAVCQFKSGKFGEALMNLEEVLTMDHQMIVIQAFRLMIIIKISERDFYEACHLIQRAKNLEISQQSISIYKKFSEGVVCLIKRKITEGLQILESIRELVMSQKLLAEEQNLIQIRNIFHMYTAYGYFCEGEFKRSRDEIKKQKKIFKDQRYQCGLQYNLLICQGIIAHVGHRHTEALEKLTEAEKIYQTRPQPSLYKFIIYSKLYLADQSSAYILHMRDELKKCYRLSKQMNNNCGANIFFHSSVYHAYLKEWTLALNDIDQAIERSEENYSKYFYVRGLILACCQSFKQSIHEVSVAITLNQKWAQLYLLRSKCLQIEGDGNQAFLDLQAYIALKPQDQEIHKYAGHLLFQNGAFEDAILAYGHGTIEAKTSNFDVFLTRAKTYFLLGQFKKSSEDMLSAYKLKPQTSDLKFDYEIINTLELIKQIRKQSDKENKWNKIEEDIVNIYQNDLKYGRIFKINEFYLLKGVCQFYQANYLGAIDGFKQCIRLKEQSFNNLIKVQESSQFQEEENQKRIYINQMYYNLTICFLQLKNYSEALNTLKMCEISVQSKVYDAYTKFLTIIQQYIFNQKQPITQTIQVFSLLNKLSAHLPQFQVLDNLKIKLCIPYPKVEPPQIFPQFDSSLFESFNVDEVQRKPQAPWIEREQNSIKFTDKIEVYSKLQFDESQISRKHSKRVNLINDHQDIAISDMEESEICIKDKLKLDYDVQQRLQRLINKSTS